MVGIWRSKVCNVNIGKGKEWLELGTVGLSFGQAVLELGKVRLDLGKVRFGKVSIRDGWNWKSKVW